MSSTCENTGTGMPETDSAATLQSVTPEYDTIRVLRPGEEVEDLDRDLGAKPPKLKLKLRNLAPKSQVPSVDHASDTVTDTAAKAHHPDSKAVRCPKPLSREAAPLQWVVTTPSTSTETRTPSTKHSVAVGTANNPIDVETLKSPSPHRFLIHSTGYFAPIPLHYRPSRPKLAPKLVTPNGATIWSGKVSGHQSHDIYKMLGATQKVPMATSLQQGQAHAAGPAALPQGMSSVRKTVQVPIGAQSRNLYVQNQPPRVVSAQHERNFKRYEAAYHTPTNGYPIFPTQDEDQLRKRVVQLVLDHSRPRPRKRRFSDDPDETSESDYESAPNNRRVSAKTSTACTPSAATPEASPPSTPSTGTSEDNMFDRNLRLTEMVEHTQLLTSLLMAYPYSTDQKGLRDDITMLASISHKRCESWITDEAEYARKRRKLSPPSSPSPSPDEPPHTEPNEPVRQPLSKNKEVIVLTKELVRQQQEEKVKQKREEEVRRLLSADSSIWKRPEKDSNADPLSEVHQASATKNFSAEGHTAGNKEPPLQQAADVSVPSDEGSVSVHEPELLHNGASQASL